MFYIVLIVSRVKSHEKTSVRAAFFKSPNRKSITLEKNLKIRPNTREIEQILEKEEEKK